MPPAQQPLLPVQHGSPVQPGGPESSQRPGSQQLSPAKELVVAVQQGDVEGVLRAASSACLRSPLQLLAVVAMLMATVGLVAWLLPQQPLPGVLHHVALRQASPWQRTIFEKLTKEEQQLIVKPVPDDRAPGRHKTLHKHKQTSREEMLDALIFPQAHGEQGADERQQQQQQQQRAAQGPGIDGRSADSTTNSSEHVLNIHEVAKVMPLFGRRQE